MAKKYKVIDNFLSDSDFIELVNNISPESVNKPNRTTGIGWEYINEQVLFDEPDHLKKVTDIELLNPIHQWFFGHVFLTVSYQSYAIRYIAPLLDKIVPLGLHSSQANFTVQQEKRGRSPFHIDYPGKSLKHTLMVTSIFYVNTTNGPTILEDGTEIECRANRLVSFPYDTNHAGVLCTDQPYRIVINLNYFKDLEFS